MASARVTIRVERLLRGRLLPQGEGLAQELPEVAGATVRRGCAAEGSRDAQASTDARRVRRVARAELSEAVRSGARLGHGVRARASRRRRLPVVGVARCGLGLRRLASLPSPNRPTCSLNLMRTSRSRIRDSISSGSRFGSNVVRRQRSFDPTTGRPGTVRRESANGHFKYE